ncbi:hypothetical protein HETIRDRAFT_410717 [Heterobasidion irregulare TC 32-1]|uniref:Uncharacterized protein n=1 Tax=Heterobasidion irregulare (strain TC 32-1) TaxID=747525 RepID=W4JZ46_HETIT|nr:uncharacterized protein HETIRDRAFT_410717 [Heterobasidion irregulare TC 32-1]ETW78749.1 hypothetical protein HETIRDRAFT_410717 [Heterobasidion irregulare TC 32-1]
MRHQINIPSLDDADGPSSSERYSFKRSAEILPDPEGPCSLEQNISDAAMKTQSDEYRDFSRVEIPPSSAWSGWGRLAKASSYIKSNGVSAFGAITYYDQLREADNYDVISGKLVAEWYTVGASLLGMAALVVTIFGFTPDGVFDLHECVVQFVAVCSVATGVGLAVDVMLLLKFSSASGSRFKILATGVYSSLVFFAITSRVPLLMLAVSVCSMALFLISMSWSICWQTALCISTLAATLLLVQYIIFSVRFVIGSIAHFQRQTIRLVHRLTQKLCDRYFGKCFAESGGGSIYRA